MVNPLVLFDARVLISHRTGTGVGVLTSSSGKGIVNAGTTPTDSNAGSPPPPVPIARVTAAFTAACVCGCCAGGGQQRDPQRAVGALREHIHPAGHRLPFGEHRRGLVAGGHARQAVDARQPLQHIGAARAFVGREAALDVGLARQRQHGGFGQRLERRGCLDHTTRCQGLCTQFCRLRISQADDCSAPAARV